MIVSQNGWTAGKSLHLDNSPVPGTSVQLAPGVLAGDVATVLHWVASQFNARVEHLQSPGCWGHAFRVVRSGVSMSNHSSGTAMDLNAPRHPLGKVGTFTPAQVAQIRAIVKQAGVIRWGGDYTGRKDEMHFEVVGNAAQVRAAAQRLTAKPVAVPAFPLKPPAFFGFGGVVQHPGIGVWQRRMVEHRRWRLAIDGEWGPQSDRALRLIQQQFFGRADGKLGKDTWAKTWTAPVI